MKLELNIRKKRDGAPLDISLEMTDGIVGLMGTVESGRSDILSCIAGALTPDEGHIEMNDLVLFDSLSKTNLPMQKRRVGILTSTTPLFPEMTVDENIRLSLMYGGKEEMLVRTGGNADQTALTTQVTGYLHDYHMDGLGGYYPQQLSQMQQIRAKLARMMAASPKLILLDDPFHGLDAFSKSELIREVKKLVSDAGILAIYASDNWNEIYAAGDILAVVDNGKCKSVQKKNDFFDHPDTLEGAALSGCSNITKVRRLDDHHAVSEEWGDVFYRKEQTCPEHLAAVGIRAHDLTPEQTKHVFIVHEPSIEETPHEWVLTFRPNPRGAANMYWKVSKDKYAKDEILSIQRLYVKEDQILWLSAQ